MKDNVILWLSFAQNILLFVLYYSLGYQRGYQSFKKQTEGIYFKREVKDHGTEKFSFQNWLFLILGRLRCRLGPHDWYMLPSSSFGVLREACFYCHRERQTTCSPLTIDPLVQPTAVASYSSRVGNFTA